MPTGIYERKKEDIDRLLKNSGNPKGNQLSEETKKKMRKSAKNRKKRLKGKYISHSLETLKKISKSVSLGLKGKSKSLSHKENLRKARLGKKAKEETKKKMRISHLGKKHSIKTRKAMSGKNSVHWKGGSNSENSQIRQSIEYKLWRESVFKRDNYQCIWGGKEHGNKLEADHIKSFSQYPQLRFAIDNGRTLCKDCHKKTDTYLWKAKQLWKKQMNKS